MKTVVAFLAVMGVALAHGYFPGDELSTEQHNIQPLARFVRQAGYGSSRPSRPSRPIYGQPSYASDLQSPDYTGYPGHYTSSGQNSQPVYGTGYPGYPSYGNRDSSAGIRHPPSVESLSAPGYGR